MNVVLIAVGLLYVLLSVLLIGFGANLAWFSLVVWRRRPPELPPEPSVAALPSVTVQLPIYNELYVSERVIEAACGLEYPRERLQIQVLDDSTDATSEVIARAVRHHRRNGIDIMHLRRQQRTGFKAGALRDGLRSATGEFVAIFDADFVPEPDFLLRSVPCFDEPDVAFVQARWGHLNRGFSWLTRLQALAIDAHFLVEQSCRGRRDYWFNFNGTAGIWRVAAIEDAGGWTAETLTEDLDLSYRAHLRGWRGHFLPDLVVPGELPAQMSGFRRQQHRWARGSLECAARLLPSIWRSPARLAVKFQATTHLTSYAIHLLLFGVTVLYPLVVLAAAEHPGFRTFFGIAYPFALFSLAPVIFFVTGQRRQDRPWWRELHRVVLITLIGPGLMVNTVRAALQILTARNPEFERTAKFGLEAVEADGEGWTKKRYQLGLDRIVFAEVLLGFYCLGTAWLALRHGNWAILTYGSLFGVGLLTVVGLTLGQAVTLARSRGARARQVRSEDVALAAAGEPLAVPVR